MKNQIESALRKGLSFIFSRQLPSGEFQTVRWQKSKVSEASYIKSPFITSFILHSIRFVPKFVELKKEIGERATEFLLGEMENWGLWRFYGKKSHIHFDMDTTSCVLAALKEWEINLDYEIIAFNLLKYRNTEGIFNTWLLDIDPPFEKKDNNIDWVVNANVLFFYSLMKRHLPEVEKYLIRIVKTETFKRQSPYYGSPFCFAYCLTRVFADGHNHKLKPAIIRIKNHLLDVKAKGRLNNSLEIALMSVALLNCDNDVSQMVNIIEYLLNLQNHDGSWPLAPFFNGGPYTGHEVLYGSKELTTAIALEAVSKYVEKSKIKV